MNPIAINSANVVQFGFSSVFNLISKKLILSVSGLTLFNTGGAANIVSIKFNVIDPTGQKLGPFDLNLSTLADIEVFIGNTFGFGYFTITGELIDQDGKSYSVIVTPQEICRPDGWNGKEVKGSFSIKTNCSNATAIISDLTDYSYKKLLPIAKQYDGKIFYPDNLLNETDFSFAPFQIGGSDGLYSGTYRIKNTTLATFDLGENVSIIIPYFTISEQQVDCSGSVSQLLCCIEDVQNVYEGNPNSIAGLSAKTKLNEIAPDLMLALIKDSNGKDASKEVKKIRKILNCDCGCGSGDVVRPSLIGSNGGIDIIGSGATIVDENTSGNSVQYEVHSKNVSIVKYDQNDPAFTINKTENQNNIIYAISFNYEVLSTTILNTIKSNSTLVDIFNEIVRNTVSSSIQGIDGECVLDFTCDYSLNESSSNRTVSSILIGGQLFTAPGSLLLSNAGDVEAWLNGLDKGTFDVSYDGTLQKTTINSQANENIVYQLNVVTSGVAGVLHFTRSCTTLKEVLQGIIDYLCGITTGQVYLNGDLVLTSKVDGELVNTTYSEGSNLHAYLIALGNLVSQFFTSYSPPTNGTNGTNGRSVKVFVQPSAPTVDQGPFQNGDIWIVE